MASNLGLGYGNPATFLSFFGSVLEDDGIEQKSVAGSTGHFSSLSVLCSSL